MIKKLRSAPAEKTGSSPFEEAGSLKTTGGKSYA